MLHRSKAIFFLGATLATVNTAALAQLAIPAPIERAYTQTLEVWPKVGLDVAVLDKDDRTASGISATQLSIRDNGRAVVGASLTANDGEAQSLCLLVDTSGSTYGDRKSVDEEIDEFLQDLPAQDELCIVTFASKAILDMPLTTDRRNVVAVLQFARKASGGSAVLDALKFTAQELEQHARFRTRAIVLISDGGDNASSATEQQVVDVFQVAGGPVLYLVLSPNANDAHSSKGQTARKQLKSILEETGGLEFAPKGEADRKAAVQNLLNIMATRYRLVFTAPDSTEDGSKHHLDIQLDMQLRKQKMNLVAARGYDAPGH